MTQVCDLHLCGHKSCLSTSQIRTDSIPLDCAFGWIGKSGNSNNFVFLNYLSGNIINGGEKI